MNKKYISTFAATAVIASAITPFAAAEASTKFTDITPNTELAQAVNSLVERGVISGMGDGTYRPDQTITRGQAAKIIAGALNIQLDHVSDAFYNDVPENHMFAKYIYALANQGIVNSEVNNFNPDQIVTRSQMAKMISESFGFYNSVDIPFTDVQREEDIRYVGSLYKAGITKGISDTLFGVNSPVTRGQMAIFIHRAEQQTADSKLIFKAADYGEEYVRGGVILDNSYYDSIIETFDPGLMAANQWFGFRAVAPGTTHIFVHGFDQGSEGGPKGVTQFYKVDVTEVNGRLVMETTLLDEPMYIHEKIYIDNEVKQFKFTYTNGEEVPAELIEITGDVDNTWATLLTGEAELLLTKEYLNGEVIVTAIDYDVHAPYTTISSGLYISANPVLTKEYLKNQYGITSIQSVKVEPFINGWDEELESAVKSATVIDGDIHLEIEKTGTNTIWVTDEEGYIYDIFFSPTAFGNGFMID